MAPGLVLLGLFGSAAQPPTGGPALACGSHNGEPMHVDLVRAWLERLDCQESDLACGAYGPSHAPSAAALARSGRAPSPATNGCSGKHAGFLTVARHLGAPTRDYCAVEHPVQQLILSILAELSDSSVSELHCNSDFCLAPNVFAPFEKLALAFARMTDRGDGSTRGLASARILDAIAAHPELVAGTDRFCTDLARAAGPDVVGKAGAEGAYVAFLRRQRQVLLVKIDDGADRAAQLVTCNILERRGALSPAAVEALGSYLVAPFLSSQGDPIGSLRPAGADVFRPR